MQELLGHTNFETTMVYTHVLNNGRCPVRSPLDQPGGREVIACRPPRAITGTPSSNIGIQSALPARLASPDRAKPSPG